MIKPLARDPIIEGKFNLSNYETLGNVRKRLLFSKRPFIIHAAASLISLISHLAS